jgi:hypothetical protein
MTQARERAIPRLPWNLTTLANDAGYYINGSWGAGMALDVEIIRDDGTKFTTTGTVAGSFVHGHTHAGCPL